MCITKVQDPTTPTRSRVWVAAFVALSVFLSIVPAANAQFASQGTIGFYFDPELTQTSIEVTAPNTPVTVYLAITDMLSDEFPDPVLNAYEIAYEVPSTVFVLSTTFAQSNALNVGAPTNLIVGTGENLQLEFTDGKALLATIQMLVLTPPTDLRLTPRGTTPSSANPAAPLWNDVSGGDGSDRIYYFENLVSGVMNPVPCEVADADFSGTVVRGLDGSAGELWTYDAGKTVSGVLVTDIDGDGDANVVYWTEDDGAENGEIGALGCQGDLIWNFVDSGLPCDPADGNFVDVVDFTIGDFVASNGGDELLLVSTASGLTRLTLHALDGSLIGGNAEIWAGLDFEAYLTADGAVYLAGADATTGDTALLRDTFADFRGSTVDEGVCAVGGVTSRVLPTIGAVSALDVTEGVLTVTGANASVEVDAVTLESLEVPCTLASVTFEGDVVTGLDGEGETLWTYTATANVVVAEVSDGEDPIVFVLTEDTVRTRLDCNGLELSAVPNYGNCYFDEPTAVTTSFLAESADGALWFLLNWPSTGNSLLASLVPTDGDFEFAASTYDIPGTVTASLLGTDEGGFEVLYLGFANGLAGGAAHVIALRLDAVSGSAPPVQGACEAGSELWSALFDGSGELPEVLAAPSVIAGDGIFGLLVTIDGEEFELDATDGSLIDRCDLAEASADGSVVTGRDGAGNALFTYDAPGGIVLVDVFELEGFDFPVVIGLADASDTTQATAFLLDCDGEVVYETPLVGATNCFGAAQPQAAVNGAVTGVGSFTAEGATELWAVMSGSAGDGEPTLTWFVTVDLVAWDVLGSYLYYGAVDVIQPLDGFPLQVALGATNADTGFAAAALIEAGANGESAPGCEIPARRAATGELWAVDFDGVDAPLVDEPFTSIALEGDNLNYGTDGGASYLLRRSDGALLTDVLLSITPEAGEAKPGETYAIALALDNASSLAAVQGVLTYDAASLAVVDAAGALAGFSSALNTTVAGEIRFAFASDSNLGEATGTLMNVEFEVAADAVVGTVDFTLSEVEAFDETPSPVGIATADASLELGCATMDVNGDGMIRSDDAVLTLRIGVGLADPTPQQECAADVNEDGEVDSGDAVMILREVVGLPTGVGVARQVALQIDGEGTARALGHDRYEVEMVLRGADVAGVDLTLGATHGATIETVGLVDAAGTMAFRRARDTAFFAAANATALSERGDVRVRVVVRDEGFESGDALELRVLDGTTYSSDGARGALDAATTLIFDAPANEIARPHRTELLQNAPNPFNPRTEIFFRLAEQDDVRVQIYDVAGRRVATLNVGTRDAGEHSVVWQGTDDLGRAVASGVYLYQLETRAGVVGSKRMTLVR